MALLPRRLARGVTLGVVGVLVGCSAIPGLAPQAPRTTVTVISVVPQAPATETQVQVQTQQGGQTRTQASGTGTTEAPAATSAPSSSMSRYSNPRYRFACSYPRGWSTAESDNGDGVTATSPGGRSQVLCFGSSIADGDWEGELDSRRSSFASDGWNVTSSKRTRLWQAVSGTQGDQIRYGRYDVNGPPVIGIEWTYPASQKARFDGLVTRAVRDLDITDSGG